jgi:hypothetical protein
MRCCERRRRWCTKGGKRPPRSGGRSKHCMRRCGGTAGAGGEEEGRKMRPPAHVFCVLCSVCLCSVFCVLCSVQRPAGTGWGCGDAAGPARGAAQYAQDGERPGLGLEYCSPFDPSQLASQGKPRSKGSCIPWSHQGDQCTVGWREQGCDPASLCQFAEIAARDRAPTRAGLS